MSVIVERVSDNAIHLIHECAKGEFEFRYDQITWALSRCLCIHGSHYRGGKSEICLHARSVVRFLVTECNKEVIP